MGSITGCGYSIFFLPCLRAIKSSILSIGPGRYKAFIAIKSSMTVGFSFFKNSRIPDDSNWKTPIVRPFANNLYTSGSSREIFSMFIVSPLSLIRFTALSITVRFLKPRKSSFKSPNSSSPFISYCEVTSP